MSEELARIKRLKEAAQANRNLGLYEEALLDLSEAVERGEEACGKLGDTDPEFRGRLLRQIADCYGIMGGIYRRWDNRLDDALQMYRKGLQFEQELGLDSYNLSNVIAVSLMRDGNTLPDL